MSLKKSPLLYLGTALAVSCLVAGLPALTLAQSNSGFTIFSGVDRGNILDYYLDFGGRPDGYDRYRLRIPAKKMELGAAQFNISYPDYYDGTFDTDDIEVKVKGKSVPISEVTWDKENHLLQIYMQEAVLAGNRVEIVLSNVRNPRFGGTYYFNCQALTPGEVPLPRNLGTWIVSITRG